MFKDMGHKNRLIMLALLLWALGEGLWFNLRQLYLVDLGASHEQVGMALALESIARATLLVPTGLLVDRVGPHRMMLASWLLGIVGMIFSALATTWPMLVFGLVVYGLSAFAIPAVTTYALSSLPDKSLPGISDRTLGTLYAAYPVGWIISPGLGGLLSDLYGIRVNMWISLGLFSVSTLVIMLAGHVAPEPATRDERPGLLLRNRHFVGLILYYMLATFAVYVGFPMIPNFLQEVRGFSLSQIGLLFAVFSVGTALLNFLVSRANPRWNYVALVAALWLAILGVWQVPGFAGVSVAFLILGGLYTVNVLATAGIARVVRSRNRGLAFGILGTMNALALSGASRLAGNLYAASPERPFVIGLVAVLPMLALWFVVRSWQMPGEAPVTEIASVSVLGD